MTRECEYLVSSADGKKALYIDKLNKDEILKYVSQSDRHRKKWMHIVHIVLEGIRNTELYDKENINERCNDVTAMKFFKGQENDRLYCKEMSTENVYVIVAVELYEKKKSSKLSKKEKNVIEKIAGYEYRI